MFERVETPLESKELYDMLLMQMDSLMIDTTNDVTRLSQAAALLHYMLEKINWVGFYLLENNQLVLGPFNGLPACTPIEMGKGVCGTVAQTKKSMVVEDVDAFPGHIACDSMSKSEIVIPILNGDKLFGVLDIDSPIKSRFTDLDESYLLQVVHILEKYLDFR